MNKKNILLGALMLALGVGLGVLLADAKPANAPTETPLSVNSSVDMHTHAMHELPKGIPVPTVNLVVAPDSKDGWNLNIQTTNFVFTPEHAGKENITGEGHAHVYVDGKKVGRAYGNWYYLGGVSKEPHSIVVTLNTNDHKDYVINGEAISSSVDVGTKNTTVVSEKKDFTIEIKENKISSGTGEMSVKEGDTVSITVTADNDEEFHLHGYDKSVELKNRVPSVLSFTANMTGRFPFELEKSKAEIGVVNVYPR